MSEVIEENMKINWKNNLGVAETIFEDEYENDDENDDEDEDEDEESLSSPPLSFPLSSPFSPLQSGVDSWTEATKRKPDVKILVRGVCFQLHKDVLISKSGYFKRQLTRVSEFTLSPPLKITAETFKQVADFCYTNHAVITPSNIAALCTAAQLLEMDIGHDEEESLCELTESYFREVVVVNRSLTVNVFRTCLGMLPEAEQTAFLVSRCIETMLDDGEGGGAVSCADGLKAVAPEAFRVVAESMQRRYSGSHDLLYRVVDLYFLVYNGKMSEDQKTQITSCIDCSILSPSLLMHAVQNPRMPLRFIVQAMLIEQLNTHRSLFTVLNTTTATASNSFGHHHHHHEHHRSSDSPTTLGAILERDAALRQVNQMRATIDTTCSRIKTLEKELSTMKKLLLETETHKQKGPLLVDDHERRSMSCRFSNNNNNDNKVERGERGSISSSFLRFGGRGNKTNNNTIINDDDDEFCDTNMGSNSSSCNNGNDYDNNRNTSIKGGGMKRNFGQRLIRGLRYAFGGSSNNSKLNGKLINDGGVRRGVRIGDGFENQRMSR